MASTSSLKTTLPQTSVLRLPELSAFLRRLVTRVVTAFMALLFLAGCGGPEWEDDCKRAVAELPDIAAPGFSFQQEEPQADGSARSLTLHNVYGRFAVLPPPDPNPQDKTAAAVLAGTRPLFWVSYHIGELMAEGLPDTITDAASLLPDHLESLILTDFSYTISKDRDSAELLARPPAFEPAPFRHGYFGRLTLHDLTLDKPTLARMLLRQNGDAGKNNSLEAPGLPLEGYGGLFQALSTEFRGFHSPLPPLLIFSQPDGLINHATIVDVEQGRTGPASPLHVRDIACSGIRLRPENMPEISLLSAHKLSVADWEKGLPFPALTELESGSDSPPWRVQGFRLEDVRLQRAQQQVHLDSVAFEASAQEGALHLSLAVRGFSLPMPAAAALLGVEAPGEGAAPLVMAVDYDGEYRKTEGRTRYTINKLDITADGLFSYVCQGDFVNASPAQALRPALVAHAPTSVENLRWSLTDTGFASLAKAMFFGADKNGGAKLKKALLAAAPVPFFFEADARALNSLLEGHGVLQTVIRPESPVMLPRFKERLDAKERKTLGVSARFSKQPKK